MNVTSCCLLCSHWMDLGSTGCQAYNSQHWGIADSTEPEHPWFQCRLSNSVGAGSPRISGALEIHVALTMYWFQIDFALYTISTRCQSIEIETTLQTLNVPFKDKKGWAFAGPVLFFLEASCALRAMRRFGFNLGSYFPVFVGGLPPSKLFQAQAICDAYSSFMDDCSIDFVQHFQLHCSPGLSFRGIVWDRIGTTHGLALFW